MHAGRASPPACLWSWSRSGRVRNHHGTRVTLLEWWVYWAMRRAVHCAGLGGALGVLQGRWTCPLSTPWGRNPRIKCAPRPQHDDSHYAVSRLEQNRRARTPERAVEAHLREMDEHVRVRSRRDEAEPTSTVVLVLYT